jgi:hypothetical protein
VRLGTCIALELVVVAGALGAVWVGVDRGADLAGPYFQAREAAAASRPVRSVEPRSVVALPRSHLPVAPPRAANVFGIPDGELLAPLGNSSVTRLGLNRGGTSLSIRLDFASGARAAFKPEQTHLHSDPRREIAAYRIDRLLGIGHVAPAKPAKFKIAELVAAADPTLRTVTTQRILGETRAKAGEVRGFIAWWIPEIRDARIGEYNVDTVEGMALWTSYLRQGAKVPESARALVDQLASLVVFDVVIDNADRWSGSNVKVSPDRKTLYFMDNTLSFSQFTKGHDNNLRPLYRMQVFPRALVARLRALTLESLTAVLDLGDDPAEMGPLLTEGELAAVMSRRDHVLAYIDRVIAQFGEDAVLALP